MKRFLITAGMYIMFAGTLFAQAPPSIRLIPYLSGLSQPVFITSARDGSNRLFIVQQGGLIRVVQPGSTTPTTFLNVTAKVLSGGERGLLGLAFHPQFALNRRFFIYYTRQPDGAIQISEFQASATDPNIADTAEKPIITIPHPTNSNHNGGTVAFGPDGYLYAGTGDGGSGNDPPNNAQNVNVLLGKMIRIDVDNIPTGQSTQYRIPPDNPFAGAVPGADEIYALGLRNPYRFSFDRGGTNQLWAADVGQNILEEVDIITNGGNYGWRAYEGTNCTGLNPTQCTGGSAPINHTPPIFQYGHTGGRCSITGGYVYRGSKENLPAGSYIYGDYCSGEVLLWHQSQQLVLQDTSRNIVAFGEDESGEFYMIGQAGTVERIARAQVFINGRVLTDDGRGLRNATVVISDGAGNSTRVVTSSLGFYQLDNVDSGRTYTINILSKKFRFAPQTLTITDQMTDVDFVGQE